MKKLVVLFDNPLDWKPFVLLAIILRGITWMYFGHLVSVHLPTSETIGTYFVKDDYDYFFAPVDNYFKIGHYFYLKGIPFTGRMPGYSAVYFIYMLFFNAYISLHLIIYTQFFLSAISVYLLAVVSYYTFNNNRNCFYITYALYVLAIFPGFFDFFVIAESLSVSSTIFCFYYLVKYVHVSPKNKYLVLSGFFLTWTIFLREYTGIIIILFPMAIIYFFYVIRKEKRIIFIGKKLFLFILPFIVCEMLWVAHNYKVTKQIILLESPMEIAYGDLYSKSWQSLDNLVFTWGLDASPFNQNSLGFYYRNPLEPFKPKFPDYIFDGVTTYNQDSLVHLHTLYKSFFYGDDSAQKRMLDNKIVTLCEMYKQDYITHHPFRYWLLKPANNVVYLTIFSGSGYLPLNAFSKSTLFEKCIKAIFSLLYFYVLILGSFGLLWACVCNVTDRLLPSLILFANLAIILTINLYSEIQEPRYFVQVFALLFPFAAYLSHRLLFKTKA